MHLPAIEAENAQFQHLKINLVRRNVQKLFCVLNAIRRNTLQTINNKIHQKKKKMKKRRDDVKLVVHRALSGFQEYRQIWSPKSGQKLNIKHDKINLFDPYAMGLCCEIKGKIEFILSSDVFFEKHPDFVNISESTTASLMRWYAQQSSIEVHYRRMAQKYLSSFGLGKEMPVWRFSER